MNESDRVPMSRRVHTDEYGCSDGSCIFGHPGGMHTNGGCKCIEAHMGIDQLRRATNGVLALRQQIAELENKLASERKTRFDHGQQLTREMGKRMSTLEQLQRLKDESYDKIVALRQLIEATKKREAELSKMFQEIRYLPIYTKFEGENMVSYRELRIILDRYV